MGQYIDAMAVSLLNWDEKYGTGGIKTKNSSGMDILDWEFYKSMSFGGQFQVDANGIIVSETEAFKLIVPDSNKRKEIVKTILKEQKSNKDAKGTKCN